MASGASMNYTSSELDIQGKYHYIGMDTPLSIGTAIDVSVTLRSFGQFKIINENTENCVQILIAHVFCE